MRSKISSMRACTVIAFDVSAARRQAIDRAHVHAAARELERQHRARRTCADDQHGNLALLHLPAPSCARVYRPVDGRRSGAQYSRMNLATLQLETSRLLLRPILREDFDAWAAFVGDPESARFVGGVQPRPVAWRGFLTMAGAWAMQGFAMFSVIEKASGRWIGRVGPWQPEGWPGTEVGWGIVRDRCGLGYATEAATATIDWAFAELGWTDVIHTIDVENVAVASASRVSSARAIAAAASCRRRTPSS